MPANCPRVIAMVIYKSSADVCLLKKQKKKEAKREEDKTKAFRFPHPLVILQLLKTLDGGRAVVAGWVLDCDGP